MAAYADGVILHVYDSSVPADKLSCGYPKAAGKLRAAASAQHTTPAGRDAAGGGSRPPSASAPSARRPEPAGRKGKERESSALSALWSAFSPFVGSSGPAPPPGGNGHSRGGPKDSANGGGAAAAAPGVEPAAQPGGVGDTARLSLAHGGDFAYSSAHASDANDAAYVRAWKVSNVAVLQMSFWAGAKEEGRDGGECASGDTLLAVVRSFDAGLLVTCSVVVIVDHAS